MTRAVTASGRSSPPSSPTTLPSSWRARVRRLSSFDWVPFIDLPVVGTVYLMNAEPDGPLFLGFYVAVVTAGATMGWAGSVLYAAFAVAVVALVAPTLPLWSADPAQFRAMGGRLTVLSVVALLTAALSRRLADGEVRARFARAEAARLADLDRLRTEFVESITHDLRSPLTAAIAGIDVVARDAEERLLPGDRRRLALARRSLGRLGSLIDDLVAAGQVEAGTLRLDLGKVDLRDVAEAAAGALTPLLEQKEQRLIVDLPQPLAVSGDARRLEQVLVNLLSNAHTHTPPGTRIVLRGCAGVQSVRLTVQDHGPGIPPEALDRVFERFHRSPTTGGSGIGLALSRAISELHGGRLWAEVAPGGGAAFHLELPRRAAADAAAPANAA